MAAKNRARKTSSYTNRTSGPSKHKAQVALAAEKHLKTSAAKGRNVKSRLAALTAELDTRVADVQSLYVLVRRYCHCSSCVVLTWAQQAPIQTNAVTTTPVPAAPVNDLTDALRIL